MKQRYSLQLSHISPRLGLNVSARQMLRRTQNISLTYVAMCNARLVRNSIEVLKYAGNFSGRKAVIARLPCDDRHSGRLGRQIFVSLVPSSV